MQGLAIVNKHIIEAVDSMSRNDLNTPHIHYKNEITKKMVHSQDFYINQRIKDKGRFIVVLSSST